MNEWLILNDTLSLEKKEDRLQAVEHHVVIHNREENNKFGYNEYSHFYIK